MTFAEMTTARKALEYAEKTMVCFQQDGIGYAIVTELRDNWVKQDRESSARGGQLKARIRLNKTDRAALIHRTNCVRLGTMDELTAAYCDAYTKARGKKAPKNNGWVYECAVTERLGGQTWEPDNVPFWKAPDVVINGTSYQVKGDGAEWFTERCLMTAITETGYKCQPVPAVGLTNF